MKPVELTVKRTCSNNSFLKLDQNTVIAKIKGSTKRLGKKYENALIVLFNKTNLQPLAVTRPDPNCDYRFLGLNNNLNTFIVAFDKAQQLNAVIQNNVVPK